MDIISLIINLISGAVGGNVAGAGLKNQTLGTLGNSIAGAIGGTAGVWILQALNVLSSFGVTEMSVGSIFGMVGSGAVSGGIITAIIGMIKSKMG